MEKYEIEITWEMSGKVTVEADSLEDAICDAAGCSLPLDGEYVSNSFRVLTRECDYCGGNCPNDDSGDNLCDGFAAGWTA
jgi:hypothetical protein